MKEYLDIGPVPGNENCQQVGTIDYDPIMARKECHEYIKLLRRAHGSEPDGARLGIKLNSPGNNDYLEVVCYYDSNKKDSVEYALKCESGSPSEWDDEARHNLGLEKS